MQAIISGQIKSLRPSEYKLLEKLASRRCEPQDIIDANLAERAAELAQLLGVQVGLLIEREGKVTHVAVGSRDRLYLPDLGRFRLSRARLRRLRLVVFMPHAQDRIEKLPREQQLILRLSAAGAREEVRTSQGKSTFGLEIPRDFITDLEKLRLDLVAVVPLGDRGDIGPISVAHLTAPQNESVQSNDRVITIHYGKVIGQIGIDFQYLMSELEESFSSAAETTVATKPNGAILVGVYTCPIREAQYSMDELEELARTAGVTVLDKVMQRRKAIDPKTVIGQGKLEELVLHSLDLGAELIIIDRELSPGQLRSITNLTALKVLDRSMLILDIFAQRANTSEGRLQVELAQLKYSLPRLTEKDSGLSRLTGGIGGRGPGETKLEIGRRRVRDRISDLEKRIDGISRQRALRRERRQVRGVPVIAIVGYTNAGKSTLLNTLTQGSVLVENKLFATLDPSSRRMRFPNSREVIFVDTVGFIRELPRELVTAFRATLEEVNEADVLLHLVDGTSPEMRMQIEVVQGTLNALGYGDKPRVLVLNKVDKLQAHEAASLANAVGGLLISALMKEGLTEVLACLQDRILDLHPSQSSY
ncbi:GTPase HflX [bacterium]|nr:GTPase HflX [bacterium]